MATGGEEEKEKAGGIICVRRTEIVLRARSEDPGYRIAPGRLM